MSSLEEASVPVVSCETAQEYEATLFAGDEAKEWAAMKRAGAGVGLGILRDFEEIGVFPASARLLVLVGKGHNGGDALIAAATILERFPEAHLWIHFMFGERALRPLAKRAWHELVHRQRGKIDRIDLLSANGTENADARRFHVCIDGVFGFQFRPPLNAAVGSVLARVNALDIGLRAAVDLPSGLGEESAFRADFTYATGTLKSPLLGLANAGRPRLIELGWDLRRLAGVGAQRVLSPAVLDPLKRLRPADSDKRTYGHLFLIGGSRSYPGAILMAANAALRSGVGLLTVFVSETLAPSFAAALPEAMWVGWPETPDGGLALEGLHLLRERVSRATALLIGPGLARNPETLALAKEVVATAVAPVVIDADALQPDIVRAGHSPRVLTPHAGEFKRIAQGLSLADFARESKATVVLKGALTAVCAGQQTFLSLQGGPVLARGGSGDVLAGLISGLVAQNPDDPTVAAAKGVFWHGLAADHLARTRGQVSTSTMELIGSLSVALREIEFSS